jgi:chloramphenicol-sensitive protein RarD
MSNVNTRVGFIFAFIAFFIWGFVPIFWKQLDHYNSLELMAHRILWGSLVLTIYLFFTGEFGELKKVWREKQNRKMLGLSTFLICGNWLLFVWAVNNGHILEVSLGYFINPLFNVFFGALLLGERLRPYQWCAITLAFIGVLILALSNMGSPWISLVLACTFGLYGLVRKKAQIKSTSGLFFEMIFLIIPVLIYFSWTATNGELLFFDSSPREKTLLFCSGLLTIFPLLAFGKAVINLKYGTIGLMQYIAPSLQFLIGVFIFNEVFSRAHQISFGLIWLALILYIFEGVLQMNKLRRQDA